MDGAERGPKLDRYPFWPWLFLIPLFGEQHGDDFGVMTWVLDTIPVIVTCFLDIDEKLEESEADGDGARNPIPFKCRSPEASRWIELNDSLSAT